MQIIRPPPGSMSQILQIRNWCALKNVDHQVEIDYLDHDLSEVNNPIG